MAVTKREREGEKKREIENAGNLFHAPMDGMWFCMGLLSFFFFLSLSLLFIFSTRMYMIQTGVFSMKVD